LLVIAILPLIQWILFQSIWKFRNDMEQDHSRNSLFRQFYCVFSVLTSQCNCLITPNQISNKKKFVTAGIQMPFVGHAPRLLAAIWGSSFGHHLRRHLRLRLRRCFSLFPECSKTAAGRRFAGRSSRWSRQLGCETWKHHSNSFHGNSISNGFLSINDAIAAYRKLRKDSFIH